MHHALASFWTEYFQRQESTRENTGPNEREQVVIDHDSTTKEELQDSTSLLEMEIDTTLIETVGVDKSILVETSRLENQNLITHNSGQVEMISVTQTPAIDVRDVLQNYFKSLEHKKCQPKKCKPNPICLTYSVGKWPTFDTRNETRLKLEKTSPGQKGQDDECEEKKTHETETNEQEKTQGTETNEQEKTQGTNVQLRKQGQKGGLKVGSVHVEFWSNMLY